MAREPRPCARCGEVRMPLVLCTEVGQRRLNLLQGGQHHPIPSGQRRIGGPMCGRNLGPNSGLIGEGPGDQWREDRVRSAADQTARPAQAYAGVEVGSDHADPGGRSDQPLIRLTNIGTPGDQGCAITYGQGN